MWCKTLWLASSNLVLSSMYLLLPLLLLLLQHLIIRKKDPTTQTRLIVGPYAHGSSHHTNTHTHISLSISSNGQSFICMHKWWRKRRRNSTERKTRSKECSFCHFFLFALLWLLSVNYLLTLTKFLNFFKSLFYFV